MKLNIHGENQKWKFLGIKVFQGTPAHSFFERKKKETLFLIIFDPLRGDETTNTVCYFGAQVRFLTL